MTQDTVALPGDRVPCEPITEADAGQDTVALPWDWLPYKFRERFNLFELVCLVHRQDPERLSTAIFCERLAHRRNLDPSAEAESAGEVVKLIDALPDMMLGDQLGAALKTLKKATGSATLNRTLERAEAKRIVLALGLTWPQELGEPEAAQVLAARPAVTSLRHMSSRRGDVLSPIIEKARREAVDPDAWQSVWAQLVVLANSPHRPPPLMGYTEGEGIKYSGTDDEVRWLSRLAFKGREQRLAKARDGTRRHAMKREGTPD